MFGVAVPAVMAGVVGASGAATWADEPETTEGLIVSASRTPVAAKDLGRSVSVLTGEDLRERGVRYVSDALRQLPGVAVSRAGGPGGVTQVRLRGAEANHVLVLIDGVAVSSPASGEYDFAGLVASDIERIEVLRGPQSALWGSNATAGVISIVTRRGTRNQSGGEVSLDGGSDGTFGGSVAMGAGTEDLDAALSLAGLRAGGLDVSADPGGDIDRDRNITLNGKINYDASDWLRFGATARMADRRSDYDGFAFGAPKRSDLVYDGDYATDQRDVAVSGHVDVDSLGGRLSHQARFDYTRVDIQTLLDGLSTAKSLGQRFKGTYQTTLALDAPTLTSANHRLTAAVDWQRETFRNTDADLVSDPSQVEGQQRDLYGLVAEYRGTLFQDLDLQAALRHDINDSFADSTTFSTSASYEVRPTQSRLHASVGTGVTNPTFYEQFGFIPSQFIGNANLDPEKNFGWDAGIEQRILGDQLTLDATYFHETLTDEIVTVYKAPSYLGTAVNENGDSRRQGIELTLTARPTEALTLTGNYTWTDAYDPDDKIEVRRPRHRATLAADYRFLDNRAGVNAEVVYAAGNYDFDYRAASMGSARLRLDDYALLNLGGRYKVTEAVEVYGRIENALDTQYADLDGYATQGVTGYFGLRARF
ncbi:MAG TPA: TonB-dependent receptor [Rhodospirillum rubrum]|nr:TonB-dependent receptor [Rhodospirillum rubrum]